MSVRVRFPALVKLIPPAPLLLSRPRLATAFASFSVIPVAAATSSVPAVMTPALWVNEPVVETRVTT